MSSIPKSPIRSRPLSEASCSSPAVDSPAIARRRPQDDDDVVSSGSKKNATAGPLSPSQAREVVRLLQCEVCSLLLRNSVTLPCGRSLCQTCLPGPHLRVNISYPATASRLHGFRCPFSECGKEHAVGDVGADVVLNKVLAAAQATLRNIRNSVEAGHLMTHVIAKDHWAEAGDAEMVSRLLPGGRLLAMCALMERGALAYNVEVSLSSCVHQAEADAFDAVVLEQIQEAVRPEMDCQICYAMFCDAVTTPCGHTFCRFCLQRVLDHVKYCPVCRRVLSIEPMLKPDACPANQRLSKITTAFWADLLEARKQAVIEQRLSDGANDYDMAVFVCTLSFPMMPTFLHIFEPRYRLMIRRALQDDRTFGMVLYHGDSFVELGTVLRIVNAEFFPDGRSLIETTGVSRFRILRHGNLDGYMVAKIERIIDVSVAEEEEMEAIETQPSLDMGHLEPGTSDVPRSPACNSSFPTSVGDIAFRPTRVLMDFCVDFVERMRAENVGWLTARMLAIYGDCPRDAAVFPWWFVNLLPVCEMEEYRLLGTTSVRERLKICSCWIIEWEGSRWAACLMI